MLIGERGFQEMIEMRNCSVADCDQAAMERVLEMIPTGSAQTGEIGEGRLDERIIGRFKEVEVCEKHFTEHVKVRA
jgi:hypothetical protein